MGRLQQDSALIHFGFMSGGPSVLLDAAWSAQGQLLQEAMPDWVHGPLKSSRAGLWTPPQLTASCLFVVL